MFGDFNPFRTICSNVAFSRILAIQNFLTSVCIELHDLRQAPITRSVQLPHIPVMALSQTDLFLI